MLNGNKGAAVGAGGPISRGLERAGIRIIELPGNYAAKPSRIERAAIGAAQFAKVAGAFGGAGDTRLIGAQIGRARAIPVKEEEGFVLNDGPPNGAAVVVAVYGSNGSIGRIVEPVVRVGDLVTNEIVPAAMEGIAARTRDHVDDRGAGESIFRAEVCLLYLEFFHGFGGRGIGDVA